MIARGSHSFTCHPLTNHTCLYSPAAGRDNGQSKDLISDRSRWIQDSKCESISETCCKQQKTKGEKESPGHRKYTYICSAAAAIYLLQTPKRFWQFWWQLIASFSAPLVKYFTKIIKFESAAHCLIQTCALCTILHTRTLTDCFHRGKHPRQSCNYSCQPVL